MVGLLLREGCSPDVRDPGDNTPLMAACAKGNKDLACVLLKAGADVNATNKIGISPLINALNNEYPDSQLIQLLIHAGAEISYEPSEALSPIFMVCRNNQISHFLPDFLQKKPDVRRSGQGMTVLHMACRHLREPQYVVQLVEAGCDVEAVDTEGYTPLWQAYFNTETGFQMTNALLEKGANVKAVDNEGCSLLHHALASERCTVAYIKLLIDAGCDLEGRDGLGRTPLLILCANDNLLEVNLLECLLATNPSVTATDHQGRSALHHLCNNRNGTAKLCRTLIEAGCQVNVQDHQGITAFHHLSENLGCLQVTDMADVLLSEGFDTNLLDRVHVSMAELWDLVQDVSWGMNRCLLLSGISTETSLKNWELHSLLPHFDSFLGGTESTIEAPVMLHVAISQCHRKLLDGLSRDTSRCITPKCILRQIRFLLEIIHLYVFTDSGVTAAKLFYEQQMNEVHHFVDITRKYLRSKAYILVQKTDEDCNLARCDEIADNLYIFFTEPRSLKEICRNRIRCRIFPITVSKAASLDILKSLEDYILFNDVL